MTEAHSRISENGRCGAKYETVFSVRLMLRMIFKTTGVILAMLPGMLAVAAEPKLPAVVDFNRDIRPVFSDTCFKCHGPDSSKRKGKLRLDTRDGAFSSHEGHVPFVPGNLTKSEAWRRINATNSDDLMPPAESGIKLTPLQIKLLARWIEQGAKFSEHWSFIPPTVPPIPKVKQTSWPRNEVDYFVLARLEEEKLHPSREASKPILIRRVTFDLTGLPPTPAEVDAFVNDKSPQAYEKIVDRLLHSPHYGERMALDWLDAARFADTHGYHIDSGRDMTRWRQWVIDAFNQNKPFDQFTIEQLAGDLLPQATEDQKIASGFNRNTMINFEGGAIPEEYHAQYVIDRVNTTGTVWLGLTAGCAQCHDHKYDPITQKDYYRLFAFFNNVPENGLDGAKGNAEPILRIPNKEQAAKLAKLKAEAEAAEAKLKAAESEETATRAKWEEEIKTNVPVEPKGLVARFPLDETLIGQNDQDAEIKAAVPGTNMPTWAEGKVGKALVLDGTEQSGVTTESLVSFERKDSFSYGCWVRRSGESGALLAKMDGTKELRGFDLFIGEGRLYLHLIHSWPDNLLRVATKDALPKDAWTHVFATYDGSGKAAGVKLYVNGSEAPVEVLDDKLNDTIVNAAALRLGRRTASSPLKGALADVRIYDRVLLPGEIAGLFDAPNLALAALPPEKRTVKQDKELKKYFREQHFPAWATASGAAEAANKARDEFEKTIPSTMVMVEAEKPHDTFVLLRGQYDQHGDKVTAGLPASLPAMPPGAPANRLGLAQWLVSPKQPLTARVVVNRYWQMYFGTGIVKTAEDFGSQGEWPSHPELLDWLATEFIHSGWDVRKIQKLIVMSAAYRQSSYISPELAARDPENRLLARGPRFRLPAEFIRDQALAVSGLLNYEIAGKSVSPYQPPGLWEELASREDGAKWTAQTYTQSHGPDLYRRTMYTFVKRTSPPPTMSTFDAPDRETCTVRRPRTNTPLQALVLMNDPTYLEASRKLAERMMLETKSDKERITFAYRLAMARDARIRQKPVCCSNFTMSNWPGIGLIRLRRMKLLAIGESKRNETLDPAELAAWTMVASTILNLDETVTKG